MSWIRIPMAPAPMCTGPTRAARVSALHRAAVSPVQWSRAGGSESDLVLRLYLPHSYPIEVLERRIAVDPLRAALSVTLKVRGRRTCQLPLGMHPTLRPP